MATLEALPDAEREDLLARRNYVLAGLRCAFGRRGAAEFWARFLHPRRWALLYGPPIADGGRGSAGVPPVPQGGGGAGLLPSSPMRAVERDPKGRPVYVDLEGYGGATAGGATAGDVDGGGAAPAAVAAPAHLATLRAVLAPTAPSREVLLRAKGAGRAGRIMFEIFSHGVGQRPEVVAAFGDWLRALVRERAAFAEMVRGLLLGPSEMRDEQVLLIGAQWIVPTATADDGGVQPPQDMHTDIPRKGELLSVAMHAGGGCLGTLFDPLGTAFHRSDFLGRADSGAFCYDSGSLHGGPGRTGVPGPYPAFDVSRYDREGRRLTCMPSALLDCSSRPRPHQVPSATRTPAPPAARCAHTRLAQQLATARAAPRAPYDRMSALTQCDFPSTHILLPLLPRHLPCRAPPASAQCLLHARLAGALCRSGGRPPAEQHGVQPPGAHLSQGHRPRLARIARARPKLGRQPLFWQLRPSPAGRRQRAS
jgi:hypothetical protein